MSDRSPAAPIQATQATGRVVVVGSLHYDIMVEAPDRPRKGETLAGYGWRPKHGGKGGNQAAAARRHGAPTAMVGAVGADAFGAELLDGLSRASVDHAAVEVVAGVKSGMSVAIFDDDGDYGAVIVSGANLAIAVDRIRDALFDDARVLILQNEIPEAVNVAAARAAREHDILVILNAAPVRPFETALPDLIDLLVVNSVEAEMLGGGSVGSLAAAAAAATTLTARFKAVVVTAGGDGVAFCDRSGRRISLPSIPISVASTHGAGDSFVGTLAACLAAGGDFASALETANRKAAHLVATPEDERTAW